MAVVLFCPLFSNKFELRVSFLTVFFRQIFFLEMAYIDHAALYVAVIILVRPKIPV